MDQKITDQAYEKAKKKVEKIKAFYGHLMTFMIVNLIILAAVLFWNGDFIFFFIVSVCGWGIGLFAHALNVFQWNPFMGKDWEQRKLQEILEEQEKS
ncbi:2TM domain-containing protein [Nonlabens sp.]|uniref:2TM domain-containing protein n=1 Tax=Nonlabens sp. TaxID=1888209 RepID=UPI003F69C175